MRLMFTAAEVNHLIIKDLMERKLLSPDQETKIVYVRSKAEQMLVNVDIYAPGSKPTVETQLELPTA